MSDLISRSALLRMMSHWKPYMDMGLVRQAVKKSPTVDAVPVVRCKDCKYMAHNFNPRFCNVWRGFNGMGDDGFCNYGERKDNATD